MALTDLAAKVSVYFLTMKGMHSFWLCIENAFLIYSVYSKIMHVFYKCDENPKRIFKVLIFYYKWEQRSFALITSHDARVMSILKASPPARHDRGRLYNVRLRREDCRSALGLCTCGTMLCKAKKQYLLTRKVSGYWLLALQRAVYM